LIVRQALPNVRSGKISMARSPGAFGYLLLPILWACQGDASQLEVSPDGAVVDLVLEENDSLYVARPLGMVVHPDGSVLISDGFFDQVVRFDRGGRALRVYGRSGDGPGELRWPFPIFLWGEHLAVGTQSGTIVRYDLESGAFVGATEAFAGTVSSALVAGDTVWLGNHDYMKGTLLSALTDPQGQAVRLFPLRDAQVEEPQLQAFDITSLARVGDGLLVGISGWDTLWVVDEAGNVQDSFLLPAARRKASPTDLVQAFRSSGEPGEAFELFSPLASLHELSDGFAALHHDYTVIDYDNFILETRLFGSLIAPDLHSGCVDQLILQTQERPVHAWSGDTLFVAYHHVTDASAELRVQGFLLDPRECVSVDLPR